MKLKTLNLYSLLLILTVSCNNENLDNDPNEQACDGGTITGSIRLSTQQQVNDFGAMCYTKIDGVLIIDDLNEEDDKIVDLSPLINLKEIYTETYPDSLWASFHFRTSLLTNFEGLNNLESVGRLVVQDNLNLESFNGLESLSSIGTNVESFLNELNIRNNVALQNLNGLNNLTQIGYGTNITRLNILGNPSLQNIDGLEGLERVISSEIQSDSHGSGNIWIYGNQQLSNVDGLSQLIEITGRVSFLFNGDLIGPNGCVGYYGNASLNDFCGLQNLVINGEYDGVLTGNGISTSCYDGYAPSVQDIIDGNCSLN